MTTIIIEIDGWKTEVEEQEDGRLCGVVRIEAADAPLMPGSIVFSGRTLYELRANFREALKAHPRV